MYNFPFVSHSMDVGMHAFCAVLLFYLIRQFTKVDFFQSILVGDKESDIESGINAGIGRVILVRSGHAIDEEKTKAMEIIDGLWDLKT
jgi:histidinol phosphatase-like enzyme